MLWRLDRWELENKKQLVHPEIEGCKSSVWKIRLEMHWRKAHRKKVGF